MKLALHWKIIIGLFLGVIWALLSSYLGWSKFTIDWISPFGTIFINVLKLIAVPLVLFSIIKGITGLTDASSLGRMGMKTLLMYLITTITAVSLGLTLVNVFQPGTLMGEGQRLENRKNYELFVAQTDGVELIDNQVLSEGSLNEVQTNTPKNDEVSKKINDARKVKDSGPLKMLVDMVPSNIFRALGDNGSMLQIIFFALFFGISLLFIPAEFANPVNQFVAGANEVFLKMVDLTMQAAPFFVFALLAGKISEMAGDDPGNVIEIFKGLGWYSLTVFAGLALMVFVFYPTIMMLLTRGKIGYKKFFKSMAPAQMLAFSTSSSAATLPVTMDCVENKLGVSEKVTSFVLPIGATVNMDGTSLYQAVAVVFLAQFHMVDLSFVQQLTIILTATLASIGSAAVPSAGLVMLIIVLESVGLDPTWIAIVFPVDRILDMCRTVVNVTGDATVASVIATSEGEINLTPDTE